MLEISYFYRNDYSQKSESEICGNHTLTCVCGFRRGGAVPRGAVLVAGAVKKTYEVAGAVQKSEKGAGADAGAVVVAGQNHLLGVVEGAV